MIGITIALYYFVFALIFILLIQFEVLTLLTFIAFCATFTLIALLSLLF